MIGENPNSHVVPGRYNPQAQAKTEVGDYLSAIYPGYIDPTQVAMMPGDTQIPMQATHPEAPQEEYRQQVEAQYQQQKLVSNNETQKINYNRPEPATHAQVIPIVIDLTINVKVVRIEHG